MSHGGLIDTKAIEPEAFKVSLFEPSSWEVSNAKKIFSTFVLPELEISLARKPAAEHLNLSDVAIAKAVLISRAQRKQAENYEARAQNTEAQIDMLRKRAERAEGHKREFAHRAREAESRLEQLEKELSVLRSEKQGAEEEVKCLHQNLQSFEAQISDLQALCTAEIAKAQQLQEELNEMKALSEDALNALGELEPKAVAACEAISSTFLGIGALATPPTLDIVGLDGLISWINETSGSLLPAAQLYGDFCAMVSARSLVQSIEMTGCDHHTALQKHTF
ncbi:uncharacterized protein LOC133897880 [Phragmites australis]|uniref:uncharacterized protein LOC133897880 n=1 Tax=Phragmites australis TaxID=29695 RepID=UPI002D79FA63|nr:uncharacterized protein LOC133897880 [Phragmites australis]